ncbi:MAG: hypothetical protein QM613_02580 [Micrococcaceae bacterium]
MSDIESKGLPLTRRELKKRHGKLTVQATTSTIPSQNDDETATRTRVERRSNQPAKLDIDTLATSSKKTRGHEEADIQVGENKQLTKDFSERQQVRKKLAQDANIANLPRLEEDGEIVEDKLRKPANTKLKKPSIPAPKVERNVNVQVHKRPVRKVKAQYHTVNWDQTEHRKTKNAGRKASEPRAKVSVSKAERALKKQEVTQKTPGFNTVDLEAVSKLKAAKQAEAENTKVVSKEVSSPKLKGKYQKAEQAKKTSTLKVSEKSRKSVKADFGAKYAAEAEEKSHKEVATLDKKTKDVSKNKKHNKFSDTIKHDIEIAEGKASVPAYLALSVGSLGFVFGLVSLIKSITG